MTTSFTRPPRSVDSAPEAPERTRLVVRPLVPALLVLVLVPTLVFVGAYVIGGHLLLAGDNLIQSYPLHVLVGSELRHGQVPGWDPYVWSGTPLLSGLNAGAFYPTTLLFAVMNAHAAWIIGEIFIFSAVGVGTCLLFSDSGVSPFASFVGAAVFAFGGAVLAQASVHTDMADGLASLPWMLLAVRRMAAPTDGRWRWAVVLGVGFGLAILGGAPEAILDVAVLTAVYAVLRWSVDRQSWRPLLSRGAVGGIIALGLAAAVWVPALHFIDSSQRANATQAFASGYYFPPASGFLAVIPYLEGGLGMLSQPIYFGQSNLGEVACYLGILPLIAVASLWTPSWGRWLPRGEQRIWYGVLLAGLVLAIGSGTPLERIIYEIPFYGRQRDSGRNIVDVDLAAAALFAWWVDGGGRPVAARIRSRAAQLAAFWPLGFVVAVGIWFAVARGSLWRVLVAIPPQPSATASIGAGIALAAALAAGAGLLAWWRDRMRPTRWRQAVCAFAFLDLALFAAGSYYVSSQAPAPAPGRASSVLAMVRHDLTPGGRFGLVDPDLFDQSALVGTAEPDLNIVDGLPSFSGYGAIVDGTYANDTKAHTKDGVDTEALRAGWLDPLGAQVLITVPEDFLTPIDGLPAHDGSFRPIYDPPGADPVLPGGSSPPPELQVPLNYFIGAHSPVAAGHDTGWFFGADLSPSAVSLVLDTPSAGQLVRVAAVTPSGDLRWQAPVRLGTGQAAVRLPLGHGLAVGVDIRLLSGSPLGPARLAVESKGRSYLVDGLLSHAVTPQSWRAAGSSGDFSVFQAHFVPSAAWVEAPTTSYRASGYALSSDHDFGSATVVSSDGESATIRVNTPRAGLAVWSTAYDAGWRAELLSGNGQSRTVPVRRVGLVVGVAVPKGASTVRFVYRPVGFDHAIWATLATLAGLALAGALALWRRLRRA